METIISRKPEEEKPSGGEPASTPPPPPPPTPPSPPPSSPNSPSSSKLGVIGLVLSVLGLIVYCGPLAIGFIAGMAGGTDIVSSPLIGVLNVVSYCGLFFGVVGGILGGVSLARGNENKVFGIISVVLGVLMLCACGALAAYGAVAANLASQ